MTSLSKFSGIVILGIATLRSSPALADATVETYIGAQRVSENLGPGYTTIVEDVSNGTQMNTVYRNGEPVKISAGTNDPTDKSSQFHATGTHVHVQRDYTPVHGD